MTMTEPEAVRIVEQPHRVHHRSVIVKRLAHPHEHDVGNALILLLQFTCEEARLVEDLDGAEIARKTRLARRAEPALEGAAGLARDADGGPPAEMFHADGFDFMAVVQPEETLRRLPVVRAPNGARLERFEPEVLGSKCCAKIGRQYRNRIESVNQFLVRGAVELRQAVRLEGGCFRERPPAGMAGRARLLIDPQFWDGTHSGGRVRRSSSQCTRSSIASRERRPWLSS